MLALWPRGAVVCFAFLCRNVVFGDANQSDSWPGRLERLLRMFPKCTVDFNTSARALFCCMSVSVSESESESVSVSVSVFVFECV